MVKVTIDVDLFHFLQACSKTITQRLDAYDFVVHLFLGNAEGFAHADDLMRRQCARTQAALVATAMHLRFDAHARFAPHIQGADPFRAVSLVCSERHQVNLGLFQVNRHLAGCLRRIAMENDALAAAQFADFINRLDHADFVVHQHDGDQDRIGTNRFGQLLDGDQAIVLRLQISCLKTLALQFTNSVEHGLVLGLDCDDVLALGFVELRSTFQRQVIAFRGAGRPDDFTGIGIDQGGDLRARFFHGLFRAPAIHVAA